MYLESLVAIGIDLRNTISNLKKITGSGRWVARGASGAGDLDGFGDYAVHLLSAVRGGMDLDPIFGRDYVWAGTDRGFLQDVDSIYDMCGRRADTGRKVTYGEMRLAEEGAVFGLQLRLRGCGFFMETP